MCGTGDNRQRVVAGTFLFMIHARLRFSEVVRLSHEPTLFLVEGFGFIKAGVKSDLVKSGQSKKRRRHTVPLVGLATGVLGLPWAETWLKLREQQGLHAHVQGTLFPRLMQTGWAAGSPKCAEANAWLRAFASSAGSTAEELKAMGTHSCKATLFSWCSKYGVRGEHRRILGGHAKPKELSMLEYSLDAMAGPLDSLAEVLAEVREGTFDPDATRSGRRGQFGRLHVRVGCGRNLGTFSDGTGPPWELEPELSRENLEDVVSLNSDESLASEGEGGVRKRSSRMRDQWRRPPPSSGSWKDQLRKDSGQHETCDVRGRFGGTLMQEVFLGRPLKN